MQDMSTMLTSLKMDLGVYSLTLPFENPNEDIARVIETRTIPTFSQFFPLVHIEEVPLDKLQKLESHFNKSVYKIDDVVGGLRLVEIRDVNQSNKLVGTGYLSPTMDYDMSLMHDLASAQASADLMSIVLPAMTWGFVRPNLLELYNVSTLVNAVQIEYGLEHSKNLGTIPYTSWESFYNLALIDVKRFLYNSMKHYTELQSAYGTVVLKIDDWANAESERQDLINRWREIHHLDKKQIYII